MTQYDDSQLVDYLFDEMSDEDARAFEQAMSEDAALSAEVDALSETLGVMRAFEDVEPPPHLDALILATARQTAEAVQAEREEASLLGRLRKLILTPAFGLAAAASLAVVVMVSVGTNSFVSAPQEASEAVPPGFASAENESASAAPAATPPVVADLEEAEDEGGAFADLKGAKQKAEEEPTRDLLERTPTPAKPRSVSRRARRASPPPPAPAPKPVQEEQRVAQALGDAAADDLAFDAKDSAAARGSRSADRFERTPTTGSSAGAPAGGAGPQRQAVTKLDSVAELDVAKPQETREVAKKRAPSIVSSDAPTKALAAKTAAEPAPAAEPESAPPEMPRADEDKPSARRVAPTDGDDRGSKEREAATLAATMIRAAEQEIARKEFDSARRIFGRAVQRVRGTTVEGDVLLRWAYFERDQRRYDVCVSLADRASRVPGFGRRAEAERLVQDASRRMEPEMAPTAPAAAPPRR